MARRGWAGSGSVLRWDLVLGLPDRGALREGLRADLVLVELQGAPGDYTVAVRGTFLAGL